MTLSDAAILVVDDEPVLRMTFAIVLRQLGATVYTAANGLEALEVLARERIDTMLTDWHMPEMDGRALLETLHARGVLVPCVFFGSDNEPELPPELARLHVVETVAKPVHPERLKQVLERVLLALPDLPDRG